MAEARQEDRRTLRAPLVLWSARGRHCAALSKAGQMASFYKLALGGGERRRVSWQSSETVAACSRGWRARGKKSQSVGLILKVKAGLGELSYI